MRSLLTCVLVILLAQLTAQSAQLVVPGGHTRAIMKLSVSPGGGLLASSSIDETVKIWETDSGRELYTFRPGEMVRDLSFSHDGRYLAVAAFTRVHVLDLKDFREIGTFKGWNTHSVRFHPQRNELFFLTQRISSTGEDPQQLKAVNIPGGNPRNLASVEMGENRGIAQLDLSSDGESLLVVLPGGSGFLVPVSGGNAKAVGYARRFTPTGELIYLEPQGNNVIIGLAERNGNTLWTLPTSEKDAKYQNLIGGADFLDGQIYWINADDKLANGNYQNGQLTIRELPEGSDRALTIAPDGWLYIAGKSPFQISRYRLPNLDSKELIGEPLLEPYLLAGSETINELSWGGPTVKSLQIDRSYLLVKARQGSFSNGRLRYSSKAALLASEPGTGDVFSYFDPAQHTEVKRYKSGYKDVRSVAARADGKALAVVATEGYLIMNTETNKSIARGGLREGDAYYHDNAAFSPDGNSLLLSPARYTGTGKQTLSYLRLINPATGNVSWERQEGLRDPCFSEDGKSVYGQIYENMVALDAATGSETRRWPLPRGRFPSNIVFDAPKRWAAYTHDDRAYVFSLQDGREYQLTVPGETEISFQRVAIFGDGFLAAAGKEGVVRIFDLRDRSYVAALVQYAETDDWAIVAPDGRFDASPGAMSKLYYRIGQRRVALEQLFEGYYTPGLAGEIFGRQPASQTPPMNLNNLAPAPEVQIGYRSGGTRNLIVEDDVPEILRVTAQNQEAVLTVTANAPGSSLAEIRLYHNGKLVGGGTRNLVVEDDVTPVGNEREYRLRLLPGVNDFKAIALNAQRTESQSAKLTIDFNGSTEPGTPVLNNPNTPIVNQGAAGVTLHLLTVGIDAYANSSYNLNYAKADASGVEQSLKISMSKLVGKTATSPLRDAGASRDEILTALKKIVAEADEDDLFVFYYAGHGVMSGGPNSEFYFVPYDVTAMTGADGGLKAHGISAREIQALSTAIPAHRQLFLLDACQSAGAVAALPGAAESKAIAQLARTTGTHWITATGTEQFASEFDQLGHGAFTYALLQALQASNAGPDGQLTVSELKAYLQQEVPELTKRFSGTAQYPASYGYGRDFAVGVW